MEFSVDSDTGNIGSRSGTMIEYVEMTVVCETVRCENSNIEISLPCALPDCVVFCGVCNFEITNKKETGTPDAS
jgi:hypothetical protein